jgi:hypothetical protein
MTKKSQIEIVGLLIIVLIITFIMIFLFTSGSNDDNVNMDSVYNENLATSLLISIINTQIDCNGQKYEIRNLIMDSARADRLSGPHYINCDNQNSLEYLNNTLDDVLSSTLNVWKKDYEFYISEAGVDIPNIPSNNIIYKKNPDFKKNPKKTEVGIVALPLASNGTITIMLCFGGCN